MTSSESPTHPDAPRAGGETPTTLKPCPFCGGDEANGYLEVMNENEGIGNENGGEATPYYRVVCHECNGLTEGGRLESHAIAAWNRRAALPSLLERHRDGERLDWLEHCNSQKRGDVPILPPSCGYSVRQYIDRQLADANTPCAAPPSPERASK